MAAVVRPSSGCSVVLATHTAGVSVDGYTLTLAANPWNIVRTYNLTPGRELLFACRYRLGTASNFVVYISEADNVNMFEGPVTGNIPEVLDNAAGPGSHPVRSSNGPGGEHGSRRQQRGRHPVPGRQSHRRAGLKAGQQRAGAGNWQLRSGHGGGPGHHVRTGRWPRTEAASLRCRAR